MNPRLTPKAQAEKVAKQKAQKEKLAEKIRDYNITFASPSGRRVLRDLMEVSGFNKSDVVVDPATGKILFETSKYNMAFRNFYIKIRSYLKHDLLKEIEHRGMEQDEDAAEVDILS